MLNTPTDVKVTMPGRQEDQLETENKGHDQQNNRETTPSSPEAAVGNTDLQNSEQTSDTISPELNQEPIEPDATENTSHSEQAEALKAMARLQIHRCRDAEQSKESDTPIKIEPDTEIHETEHAEGTQRGSGVI